MSSSEGSNGIKKLTPQAAAPGCVPAGTMPRPPAAATAFASSVVPTPPIAANCTRSAHPTRLVNRVALMLMTSPSDPTAGAPARDRAAWLDKIKGARPCGKPPVGHILLYPQWPQASSHRHLLVALESDRIQPAD